MQKISTLFKKNPDNLALVTDEIDPQNEWVFFDRRVRATRKFDGTAAAVISGQLYKRYDVKKGRQAPEDAIPCCSPDPITGHWPHWVKCNRDKPEDKYFFEAFDIRIDKKDGTFELVGPKVQGNPENFPTHALCRHGAHLVPINDLCFQGIKDFLSEVDIEGIVFHHPDGRMCKIRKSDFGIKRKITVTT